MAYTLSPPVVHGNHPIGRMFRNGVHALAARDPDLHRPEVIEVARHRRLGGLDAVVGQEPDQLLLAGHDLVGQDL